MDYGTLKTLFLALQAAPSLAGASVVFGEENVPAQEFALPMIVVSPQRGQFAPGNGYVKNTPLGVRRVWQIAEQIDIMIWAQSTDPAAQQPIDHIDAAENALAYVLQALETQRSSGQAYKPLGIRWELAQGAQSVLGRALVLTVGVDVSIINVTPPSVTVTSVTIVDSINGEVATS